MSIVFERLTVIGLGLIGSSIARGAKARNLAGEILGIDASSEVRQEALKLGVVDQAYASADQRPPLMGEAKELVIAAVPVMQMESVFASLGESLGQRTVLTDVGSTKSSVIEAARKVWGEVPSCFVPGHPIAGSEQSGVAAGDAELFAGKWLLITPLANTDAEAIRCVLEFWQGLGAVTESMEIHHHDQVLGATSHLPHVLAYALVDALITVEDSHEVFKYAAGGFRDFTRIAESDPQMWCDIVLANSDVVLDQIDNFSNHLNNLKEYINKKDEKELLRIFHRAQRARRGYTRMQNKS